MRSNSYNPDLTPGDLAMRRRPRQITDEEIEGKNSFPPPDQNRHIDAFMKKITHHLGSHERNREQCSAQVGA